LAEICGNFLAKGALVFIEGKLQTRTWDGKDGSKRYMTEVVASTMQMLDRKLPDDGRCTGEGNDTQHLEESNGDEVPF